MVLSYLDDLTAFYSSQVAMVVPGTSPVQHELGAAKPFIFRGLGIFVQKSRVE